MRFCHPAEPRTRNVGCERGGTIDTAYDALRGREFCAPGMTLARKMTADTCCLHPCRDNRWLLFRAFALKDC